MKENKYLASNKGITLLTLTITIIVMMILSFTVSINIYSYIQKEKKSNLEIDIIKLKEEIDYYYSKNKNLPIANKYITTSMLEKNVNDNDNYYVIDLSKMRNLNLKYGKDYEKIPNKEDNVSSLFDIYIVNEQSHTIYYPQGITYEGKIYYTTMNNGIEIEDESIDSLQIVGKNEGKIGETIQLTAKVIPEFAKNTGVTWSSSDESIATVSNNGEVILKKVGKVTIKVQSKDNNLIETTHTINIKE